MLSAFVSEASFPALFGASALLLFGLAALHSGLGVWLERTAYAQGHRVFALEVPRGQVRREQLAWVRFNAIAAVGLALTFRFGGIEIAEPSLLAAAGTFAACWLSFEVYYWGMHRAFHTRALFRFHRWHHDSRVTTPFTGLSTSAVEAVGWTVGFVLGPLLLSAVGLPTSALGFVLYLFYNYSGNIVGHVNAELFPLALGRRANTWWVHPVVYHSLHHARFRNHYGFGSTFMDRLFRTEWADWPVLFERVRNGSALKSLSERG